MVALNHPVYEVSGVKVLTDENGKKYNVSNWRVNVPSYGGSAQITFECYETPNELEALKTEVARLQRACDNHAVINRQKDERIKRLMIQVHNLHEKISDVKDIVDD